MKSRIRPFLLMVAHYLSGPVLISIAYFIFGFFWILFSDRILLELSPSSQDYIKYQTYKGWLYIVITTILVYALSKVYAIHKDKSLSLSREKERIISENLREKETLLKEVHHRVKNNLQIMISLIRLKRKHLSDAHDSEILKEITDKMHAIALVHEMLYQEDLLSEVNMKGYIIKMIKHLEVSLESRNRVKIHPDLEDVILPLDIAVPYGILVNEIITNILKYAFPDPLEGDISIELKKEDDGKAVLYIKDNRIEIEPSVSMDKEHAFGMRLIHILSDQLNASLHIDSEKPGTSYTLVLNLNNVSTSQHLNV
ncbi:MAG: signal transduction histidine kinase [Marinimicrobia bacterium 46_43]|nr:MAG: signal transduction histidine kinase [Marinimicrobia bacterium 46_43]